MFRRALTLPALLTFAPLLGAADVPAMSSPVAPAASAASTPPAPEKPVRWELVGVMGTREAPVVRINDTDEKTGAWLRVGESLGSLKLVAADVNANTATIQVGDERAVLALRVSTVTPGTAAPAPTAVAVTPGPLPSTGDPAVDAKRDQAIAEREARMLVSDLLEISMVQQKAYAEKQAEAASAATP